MAFGKLRNLLNNFATLDANILVSEALDDPILQAEIIEMITIDQLYNQGIDGAGKSLGEYSPFTIQYKRTIAASVGGDTRVDHITLKDTGDFYESFRFIKDRDGFHIEANTQKQDKDLVVEFGREILNLTDKNLQAVRSEIAIRVHRLLRERFSMAA